MRTNKRERDDQRDDLYEHLWTTARLGQNMLLHGPGGTGKTYLLRKLAKRLTDNGFITFCTATTGIAALNLGDGTDIKTRTLHSWAGIGLGKETKEKLLSKVASKKRNRERWNNTRVLIIDEVSMLGKDLFEKLDYIGKKIRKCEILPFGGIQMILSGDFLQLPPINDAFAFESAVWARCNFTIVPFLVPKRYDDTKYFEMLLRIRKGEHTMEDLTVLNQCVKKYDSSKKRKAEEHDVMEIKPTILHSRIVDVASHNAAELEKLNGDSQIYFAKDNYLSLQATGSISEQYYEHLLEEAIPACIQLKPGSQVMLRANLDITTGLVNGSRGVVMQCLEEGVDVKFRNDVTVRITPYTWEFQDDSMIASRAQIPLLLAWSITIHRVQGCTLDYAECNLGQSVFEKGQAYVALSRVRNLNGLYITNLYPKCIKANEKALAFENSIPKFDLLGENSEESDNSDSSSNSGSGSGSDSSSYYDALAFANLPTFGYLGVDDGDGGDGDGDNESGGEYGGYGGYNEYDNDGMDGDRHY